MRQIQQYATRYRVKPGITGLAQVYGWRGATDTEEKMAGRVSHDLYYIENWSLMLDLKILALTVLTGLCPQERVLRAAALGRPEAPEFARPRAAALMRIAG